MTGAENGIWVNNLVLKEESRLLEHNDIFTIVERSFRYEFTPEMLVKAQLASAQVADCVAGTIPLSTETPKKPSSLSASVFSISEVPSSPATPKTPVPVSRAGSNSGSTGQSPCISAAASNVVDNEITTSPKLSPKVFKMEGEVLGSVSAFSVGASSLGTSVVSWTDGHAECDKENVVPGEIEPAETEDVKAEADAVDVDSVQSVKAEAEAVETEVVEADEHVVEHVVAVETETVVTEPVDSEIVENVESVIAEHDETEAAELVEPAIVEDESAECVEHAETENVEHVETVDLIDTVVVEPIKADVVEPTEAEFVKNMEAKPVVTEAVEQVETVELIDTDAVETATTETVELMAEPVEVPVVCETEEFIAPVTENSVTETVVVEAECKVSDEATDEIVTETENVEMVESTETADETVTEVPSEVVGESIMLAEPSVDEVIAEVPSEVVEDIEMAETVTEIPVETAEITEAVETVEPVIVVESINETPVESVEIAETVSEVVTEAIESTSVDAANECPVETEATIESADVEMEAVEVAPIETSEIADATETCEPALETVCETIEVADVEMEITEIAEIVELVTDCTESEVTAELSVDVECVTEGTASVTEVVEVTLEDIASITTIVSNENEYIESLKVKPVVSVIESKTEESPVCVSADSEPATPADTEIPMPITGTRGEVNANSSDSIVKAYEMSSENNSPTEAVVAESVEAGETIAAETCEPVSVPVIEEVQQETEATEAVIEEEQEISAVIEEAQENVSVVIEAEENISPVIEVQEPVILPPNSPVVCEVADEVEVSIEPLEETANEIASPKRKAETEDLGLSTPGPQRKSTRVHVTPRALESVKKQVSAAPSGEKRILRSTGGRQLRSRVSTEPVSPKGRNQKRSAAAAEGENVDPASLSLPLTESKKKVKTAETAKTEETPVRRSTRSRVQK